MSVPDPATTDWVPLWSIGGATGVLPADTVIPAATRIISNKNLIADTQPTWRIFGDGKQEWGPGGGSAVDTNLYRSTNDILKTDDNFHALQVWSSPGGANQILLASDGRVYFGNGLDTNLYRSGGDQLKTDDSFTATNVTATSQVSANSQVVANQGAATQILLANDGTLRFGTALDTSLYRGAANTVSTGGVLSVAGDFRARDGSAQIIQISAVRSVPELIFGNDGATSLYRGAANQLYNFNNLSQWGDFKAASFAVQSDRQTKSEIKTAEVQIEKLLNAGVYTYQRDDTEKRHLGLMSDEMPIELTDTATTPDDETHLFIDLYALSTALLATIQHLDERVKALEGK